AAFQPNERWSLRRVSEKVGREPGDRVEPIPRGDRERAEIDAHRQCARARGRTRDARAAQRPGDAGLWVELERRTGRVDAVDVARLDGLRRRLSGVVAVGDVKVIAAVCAAVDSPRCRPELASPTPAGPG